MKDVTVTKLTYLSTSYPLVAAVDPIDTDEDNWMTSIIKHLKTGELPQDRVQARQLQLRAARYTMIGDVLYKQGFSLLLLKCITLEQRQVMLKEIHEGVSGTGGQALAYKVVKQIYF